MYEYKNLQSLILKKYPGGSLSIKLKTVGELMITGKKLPVVKEYIKMKQALKIINKKLGVLIIKNQKGDTKGIITDGILKETQKYNNFENLMLQKVMKKNPISVRDDTLAAAALSIMNTKSASLCA